MTAATALVILTGSLATIGILLCRYAPDAWFPTEAPRGFGDPLLGDACCPIDNLEGKA